MAMEKEMEAMGFPLTIRSLFRGCSCVILSLPPPDSASDDDRLFWKLSEDAVSNDVDPPRFRASQLRLASFFNSCIFPCFRMTCSDCWDQSELLGR
jgi:hypothetical protein